MIMKVDMFTMNAKTAEVTIAEAANKLILYAKMSLKLSKIGTNPTRIKADSGA